MEYVIDGSRINSLEDFYAEISRVLIPDCDWGRNLNAFNDILRGGFGTPENGFILRWRNSVASRNALGYPATIRELERQLANCHPESYENIQKELALARAGDGDTVFPWLVEIIRDHGSGGK